jgi:hypothetical protein
MDLTERGWYGENPYYLLVVGLEYDGQHVKIDLDEPQWATIYSAWMRTPGEWHLVRKVDNGVALSVIVFEGEQPYYTSRVFGSSKTDQLLRSYGIGKKQLDDSMVRLWIMSNGLVCGGDDVDVFGPKLLKTL